MPLASSVSRASGIAASAPTARISPSLMATLASMTLSGETTLPLRMTRSACVMASSSQHRPAAIDREVDAGDLARGVACKKQARVCDVAVDGHTLERIVRRMALHRLLDRDAELLRHVGTDLVAEPRTVDHAGRDAID